MGEQEDFAELDKGQAVILERIKNFKEDSNSKHTQNRSDIHELRNKIQNVADEVWKIKIKIAGYSVIAGILTALAVEIVKKMFIK